MGSVDRLRVSVDEEPQVVAVAAERIGVSLVADWRLDGSTGVRIEQSGEDLFVVLLSGEHDLYTAPQVREALRGAIAAGAGTVVVDLTETTFLDSTMLHVFLTVRNELGDGGRLLLATADGTVKRAFEITGIDRLFDFFPSRRAAEAEVRGS